MSGFLFSRFSLSHSGLCRTQALSLTLEHKNLSLFLPRAAVSEGRSVNSSRSSACSAHQPPAREGLHGGREGRHIPAACFGVGIFTPQDSCPSALICDPLKIGGFSCLAPVEFNGVLGCSLITVRTPHPLIGWPLPLSFLQDFWKPTPYPHCQMLYPSPHHLV